jgi:transcriptional regulator with XRE-family HTH domain
MRKKGLRDQVVKQFAARVRQERLRLSLSQYELAKRAEVSAGYLARLERGETGPGLDVITRLALALGIDPRDMLGAPVEPDDALELARGQVAKSVRAVMEHGDLGTVQALALVCKSVEQMVARRTK